MSILLEVCVDSPKGLLAAVAGGADRIELCAALAIGGLTPSPGLMALAARQPCPSRAMIRPRVGSFVYELREVDVMLGDIDAVRTAGLAGVVIGANHPNGELDMSVLRRLAGQAAGLEIALHRAIDLTPDPLAALDLAIELGCHTVLTSGGKLTAAEGAEMIAALQVRAAGRIEILAGSGVRANNVAALIAATGVTAVHGSCGAPVIDPEPRAAEFGFALSGARDTDQSEVARLKAAIT